MQYRARHGLDLGAAVGVHDQPAKLGKFFSRSWTRRIAKMLEKAHVAVAPVTALLDIGGKVIDRLWPDPVRDAQAKLELIKLQQSGELTQIAGQLEINKAEAGNPNPFTSGWRSFIGWVCAAGFALQFVVGPLGEWALMLLGHPVKLPQIDLGTMMPLLFGMLWLGAYRTAVKRLGVAGKRDDPLNTLGINADTSFGVALVNMLKNRRTLLRKDLRCVGAGQSGVERIFDGHLHL